MKQYEKLLVVGSPCFILTTLDKNSIENKRREIALSFAALELRTIRGEQSVNDEQFFNECAAALQFPYYFGKNWNAFRDCILDLEWLAFESFTIVITDAHLWLLSEKTSISKAINIFLEANEEWRQPNKYIPRNRSASAFHVVLQYPPREEDYIRSLPIPSQHIDRW